VARLAEVRARTGPVTGSERTYSPDTTRVVFDGGRPQAIAYRRCRLEVTEGPDQGLVANVDRERIRIGTAATNDLVLADDFVSRLHAEVQLLESGFRIRDLGSTNGTFMRGVQIVDAILRPGTTLQIGRSKVLFQVVGEGEQIALHPESRMGEMLGESVPMRALFAKLERVAPTDATVLLVGETGTGKDLAADAIVRTSRRATRPLVVVDCASMVPTLVESELFGHERGAFTGAVAARAGAFELADGGTVFLDEVGELPIEIQPKLLRVLESRTVRRVGAAQPVPVDVRVIAATNRSLADEVNRGAFRADLYYRLAVIELTLPPLRDRRADIPLIAKHVLEGLGRSLEDLPPELVQWLGTYAWPGNVRELRNFLERAVALDELGAEQLAAAPDSPDRWPPALPLDRPFRQAKDCVMAAFEAAYLAALVDRTDGNVSRAAREAEMNRMHLHKLLQRHGLGGSRRRRRG
jgi:transcriptional regulator with GAF, ATPase, and Fis domain